MRGEEQAHEMTRYLIRLAALYHNSAGSISELSDACGLSRSGLSSLLHARSLPPKVAIRIEEVVGREFIQRDLFRPDIFSVPE